MLSVSWLVWGILGLPMAIQDYPLQSGISHGNPVQPIAIQDTPWQSGRTSHGNPGHPMAIQDIPWQPRTLDASDHSLAGWPTIAELILDNHVIIFSPGRVVSDEVSVSPKNSVCTHLAKCSSSRWKHTQPQVKVW